MRWATVRCPEVHYRRKERDGERASTILGKVGPDGKLHVRAKTNLGHMMIVVEKGSVRCPGCGNVLDWDASKEN